MFLPEISLQAARDQKLFVVPEYHKTEAEAAFAKLARRATRRLKSEAPVLEWVARGVWERVWYIDNGDEQIRRSRTESALYARINGSAPKIAGWSLAARLILTATGERQMMAIPGIVLPVRFRDTKTECEHCNAARNRRDVFVVQNSETGEWKQVGKTCLRDFLGHDPATLLLAFTATKIMQETFDRENCSGFGFATRDTEEVLEYAAASIRLDGWHSRASAKEGGGKATADIVTDCFGNGQEAARLRKYYQATETDSKIASEALKWVREVLASKEEASDYEHNLVTSLRHPVIDVRSIGIAVSAISAHLRFLSREVELKNKRELDANSRHVGRIGERLRGLCVHVERKQIVESDFGSSYLLKFRTEDGSILSWFCSGRGANDMKPGDTIKLTGTVKDHCEYKGAKETRLSRCVLAAACSLTS